MLIWGYKADGSAKLFDLADDEDFPEGFSDDITIIIDDAHKHGEHLTKQAGGTLVKPEKGVKVKAAKKAV